MIDTEVVQEAEETPKRHAKLKEFLVQLASDLDRQSAFIADPPRAMAEAGLSEEERAILSSGDQARIYAALVPSSEPAGHPPASESGSTQVVPVPWPAFWWIPWSALAPWYAAALYGRRR